MSHLIGRWAVRLVLMGFISTIVLMLYVKKPQDKTSVEEIKQWKKVSTAELSQDKSSVEEIKQWKKATTAEWIRLKKLQNLQKTLFLNPKRPVNYPYNLNVSLSEQKPLERDTPDSRPPQCRTIQYDYEKLPKFSVVIPFYNEALSMLLRTVHGILARTPDDLLQEIILVNDNSPNADLWEPLEKYLKLLPKKVSMIRMEKREGLIRARITGAKVAKGPVVMFQVSSFILY